MQKREPRPVMVATPHKGASKPNRGLLDEPFAAHAGGRPDRATKTPAGASTRAKSSNTKPKKDIGMPLRRRLVGYARISADKQTMALQDEALARAALDIIFEEAASGTNTARPVLAKTLAALRSGDTLVVWRLDRLARSLGHLAEVATGLRERGAFLRSLTEGLDTSTVSGRLFYRVLGAVAEFERDVIRERTVAGMKAAKQRGAHVGRPPALVGARLAKARRMLATGKSQIETARILRVSRATIQRANAGGSGGEDPVAVGRG